MIERLAVGCMTGTSIDALDAALVRLSGIGMTMRAEVLACVSRPLGRIGDELRRLASGDAMSARAIAELTLRFGELHAEAVSELRRPVGTLDFVCVHGQTVAHAPPTSWQLINPWPIARAAGCPVVSDLRGADLAAGGQGAPITPIADWILFRDESEPRAVVNLGGFCNMTLLPAQGTLDDVRGMDVCACNHVLDEVARRGLGSAYDEGGSAALRGTVHAEATESLIEMLTLQRGTGRSLGSGDETWSWINHWCGRISGDDLAASATSGVGKVIGRAVPSGACVVAGGGGVLNAALMQAIGNTVGRPAWRTDDLGIPATHREAVEFAVLGGLCADGVAITLPRVTGVTAPSPIAGSWTNLPGIPIARPR